MKNKKQEKMKKDKVVKAHKPKATFSDFMKVLVFILKATFLGYGGGNALMPIIRKFAVVEQKWLDDEEFDDVVIASNMIPGPSVVEALSYVAIKKLGKFWGVVVTLIGILPHMLLAFGLYVLSTEYLPSKYLWILNVAIMPIIIAILILFVYRYIKQSRKEISLPIMITLIIGSFLFCMFTPAPYNVPAIVMIGTILTVFIVEYIRIKRHTKEDLKANVSKEHDDVEISHENDKKGGK